MSKDALEKKMATHSSVLAWRIPGTGKPGRLQSMASYRVRHNWSNLAAAVAAWGVLYITGISFQKWKSLDRVQLCDPMDGSLPDSSVHGILQARILELVAVLFSRGIFPTQGSNPGPPALQGDSLPFKPPKKVNPKVCSEGIRLTGSNVL